MRVLVFPSVLQASARFAEEARDFGTTTIGASSVETDPNAGRFDSWVRLPFIGDDGFFTALQAVADTHAIDALYTPHAPSFHLLESELPARLPSLRLIGPGPFKKQMSRIDASLEDAKKSLAAIDEFARRPTDFPLMFLAGLLSHAEHIYGECSKQKILALCAIMSDAPRGDIVEIGCLYGKSSYVLNRLAAYFDVGATLAIDAWNLGLSVQYDAPLNIQEASGGWDWETVYQGFLVNMLGCSVPPFNYLRLTSEAAHGQYGPARDVTSPEFGAMQLSGEIAVLHIDGNHDETAVERDFQLWSAHLSPGGWIVFDDYNWPHGDGPRLVADRAIDRSGSRVVRHFVAGGAMFMKVGP